MAFFDYPVYNAALASEQRIINTDHIEQVKPHADVPVDTGHGTISTACVEMVLFSGASVVVLLDYATVKTGLNAFFGVVDQNGIVS